MTPDPVRQFVLEEFLRGQDPTSLPLDQPLVSSGIIDSVGTMKLVLFLEAEYAITIDTEEILGGRLDTLRRIHELVAEKIALSRPAQGG
jgi:acyl carrier protein